MFSKNKTITLLINNPNIKSIYLKTLIDINGYYNYNFFTRAIAPDFVLNKNENERKLKSSITSALPEILEVRSRLINDYVNRVLTVKDDNSFAIIAGDDYLDSVSHFMIGFGERHFAPVLYSNEKSVPESCEKFLRGLVSSQSKTSTYATRNDRNSLDDTLGVLKLDLRLKCELAKTKDDIIHFVKTLNHGQSEGIIDIFVGGKSLFNPVNEQDLISAIYSYAGGVFPQLI